MNTTTKRYARTIDEAFPGGADYANPIERYDATHRAITRWMLFAFCVFFVCLMFFIVGLA